MESDGREVATHGQCCGTEEKSAQSAPSVVSTGGGRSAGWLLCLSKRAAGLEYEPTRTLVHTRPDARRDRGRLIPPLGGWPCLARFQGKRQRALVYVPRPLCVSVSAPVCVCVCVCARVCLYGTGWEGAGRLTVFSRSLASIALSSSHFLQSAQTSCVTGGQWPLSTARCGPRCMPHHNHSSAFVTEKQSEQ